MLYKQATMTAVLAIVLATSLLLGAIAMPALATSVSSSAGTVLTKHVSNGSDKTTTIDSVQFEARKAISKAEGTITVKIVKGDEKGSTDLSIKKLTTTFSKMTAKFDQIKVDGSFDIVIDYQGTGFIALDSDSVKTIDDGEDNGNTDTAGDGNGGSSDDDNNNGGGDDNTSSTPQDISLDNLIGGQHVRKADDASTTIKSIQFDIRKTLSKTSGTLTVAIVQDGKALGMDDMNIHKVKTSYTDMKAHFDNVKVIGDFDVVFLFDGSGKLKLQTDDDNISGNYFTKSDEFRDRDLAYTLDGTSTAGTGNEDDGSDDNSPPPTSSGKVKLTVNAIDEDGKPVTNMWIEVWDGLTMVNANDGGDYTPHTFTLEKGSYTVAVQDFEDTKFIGWKDSTQGRYRAATLSGDETFTAIFSKDGSTGTAGDGGNNGGSDDGNGNPPPPTTGEANTVTISTELLDGTAITGLEAQLREAATGNNVDNGFTTTTLQMEDGKDYRAIMYSFSPYWFRHWTDGGLHRYHLVSGDGDAHSFTAVFEQIPSSQVSELTVRAVTTDGTPIGGTTGTQEDDTLQAEPGLEVQVAPPGSMTAYTAGFTGGSEATPFHLVKGQTYTVIMSEFGQYQFDHWEDTGLQNPSRAVSLNSNSLTLTAVYQVVS